MLSGAWHAYISLPRGTNRRTKNKRSQGVSGMLARTKTKTYQPSDKEPFMNERQRDYFRLKRRSGTSSANACIATNEARFSCRPRQRGRAKRGPMTGSGGGHKLARSP